MKYCLHNLVLPGLDFGAPVELYARTDRHCRVSLARRKLYFKATGRVAFDTYFNGFSVETWKRVCGISKLSLLLYGQGSFVARIGLHRASHEQTRAGHRFRQVQRWWDEREIELRDGEPGGFDLPCWDQIETGMLYLELEALGEGRLDSGFFATTNPPPHRVKLGIVITHFNRKQYVLPAIRRIAAGLRNQPEWLDRIGLVVVDNSRTIDAAEAVGATLIPSRNLGGSGGFARGLLYLQDEGSFTHGLFMDDDASCELEAIFRAHALLSYARTPKSAVAGSLLREDEPYRLFEKGAKFDGACRSLKSGLDLRQVGDLLAAERTEIRPDYGAWWFFAFPLAEARSYPFPYFVRGDDVMFGIANDFAIHTLNGIGGWGGDFGIKKSPWTSYLDMRSHLLNSMMLRNKSLAFLAALFAYNLGRQLFSYNYASARAINLALAHLLEGAGFWRRNIDTVAIREEIADFAGAEALVPVDALDLDAVHREDRPESWPRRLLRIFSLNGFLLPGCWLDDRVLYQPKGFYGSAKAIFLHRRVLYQCEGLGIGYLASHDKRLFFTELVRGVRLMWSLLRQGQRLRAEYRSAVVELASPAFWRGVFAMDTRSG
ncbi:hypothetical protein [Methylomagnum ishizawai]|uniref:hypothetical protein n=1 Tax=Methylomagnum ishizawai TaxID=1760988 RepID=UPI001C342309|nr:hypothetical protein [Methylomagnum ishizawai]BBL74709.1 hypothetical protein MishRS11D_18070 [Methylomagnum ishizawai]